MIFTKLLTFNLLFEYLVSLVNAYKVLYRDLLVNFFDCWHVHTCVKLHTQLGARHIRILRRRTSNVVNSVNRRRSLSLGGATLRRCAAWCRGGVVTMAMCYWLENSASRSSSVGRAHHHRPRDLATVRPDERALICVASVRGRRQKAGA